MNNHYVYLAGPITGTTYSGCTDWRQYVIETLHKNIIGISPMRHKQYLNTGEHFSDIGDSYPDTVLSCQRGIFARDSWDCRRCDAVLVNVLGAERVSIGTVMEIAWAHAFHKPIVLVMEKNNIHEHSMLREACPFRVETIDEAISVLEALFIPASH